MKVEDHKWHIYTNAINEALLFPARIAKDGQRVLCSGLQKAICVNYKRREETGTELSEEEAQNFLRCGGELGTIATDPKAFIGSGYGPDGELEAAFGPANVFLLGADFGPGSDTVYRKTQRAHHRMYGPECIPAVISRIDGKRSGRLLKGKRKKERETSTWGRYGELSLPISIRCPKCNGLNSITDSLIESAPLQIEED